MKGDCSNIYKWVLDDVAACMAPEFQAANVDEAVLQELKQRWEAKLKVQGLIRDEFDPVADAATAAVGSAGARPADDEAADDDDGEGDDAGPGPSAGLGKRRRDDADGVKEELGASSSAGLLPTGLIPQHDGGDGDGDGEDGAGAGAGGSAAGAEAAAAAGEAEPEGDEILSEDDHDDAQDEEEVENLLIGQFDKVNKMKNRWKVMMKDCIFHINGKDYLFKKCTAEYHWQ